jgi:hypothetical protein
MWRNSESRMESGAVLPRARHEQLNRDAEEAAVLTYVITK